MKRLIIIGAGPHYRKKYHPILHDREIALVVDLKAKESLVRACFGIRAERYLFLDEKYRNAITQEEITQLIGPIAADGVIICTEPKVRAAYAFWAADNHLPMFLDKPATITLADFDSLLTKNPRATISCERRSHPGYCKLFSHIEAFTKQYNMPITSIDIHFAGGIWKTPTEYIEDENHPFKYGYGMLMHSGYHYVDLLARLLRFSYGKERHLQTFHATPADHIFGCGQFENPFLVSHSPHLSLMSFPAMEKPTLW